MKPGMPGRRGVLRLTRGFTRSQLREGLLHFSAKSFRLKRAGAQISGDGESRLCGAGAQLGAFRLAQPDGNARALETFFTGLDRCAGRQDGRDVRRAHPPSLWENDIPTWADFFRIHFANAD